VKELILVRHGRAQWPDRVFADFDRPLDPQGTEESQHAAQRLFELGIVPDCIVASAARRTRETASVLAQVLGVAEHDVMYERRLYLGSPEVLLGAARGLGPQIERALLVGHNPGISELARLLAPEAPVSELATAGFCRITFDALEWGSVSAGGARDVFCA
jgi:phosphohistidine phosphatase